MIKNDLLIDLKFYQSSFPQITQLKIDHNPFAKGFRDLCSNKNKDKLVISFIDSADKHFRNHVIPVCMLDVHSPIHYQSTG